MDEKINYGRLFSGNKVREKKVKVSLDNLSQGEVNTHYIITDIKSNNEEMDNFLFSLGCYRGEEVTIISRLGDIFVINIKDARYSIDENLATAIKVQAA